MYDHGGLNRNFRLVWSEAHEAFIPVSEISRNRNKRSGSALAAAVALTASVLAGGAMADTPTVSIDARVTGIAYQTTATLPDTALPTHGEVIAGQATITQSGNTGTIHQTTQNAAINWQSFDIGKESTVVFVQPNANAIALNRVTGNSASQIYGVLQANGQVFLVNPNGVLFAKGAEVNVAGILASTRDINVADFMAGKYRLSGSNSAAVINEGNLHATEGGYIALVGAQVINEGNISAAQGDVRLAAGDDITLKIDNGGLTDLTIDQGAYDALVANGGIITANAGRIFLTADAFDAVAKASVNNTGIIEATTVGNKNGKIVLLGDLETGTTNVAGTLDASAPDGGDGGFIETSAAHVKIAAGAKITTASGSGATGQWLIDPVDYTIAASGGDMTGADLTSALGSTNVTIQSTSGASGTLGDVNVNDAVTWNTNTLTLNAQNNINFNSSITASGTGDLALEFGQATTDGAGSRYFIADGVKIDLPAGQNFSTRQGSSGAVLNYTVITDLGTFSDTNATTLQGMKGDLEGLYVLGADIDAAPTSLWNPVVSDYYGFDPVASGYIDPITQDQETFTGTFDGLGHTISDLYISRSARDYVGLFGFAAGATIQNVTLGNVNIVGTEVVGAIAGAVTRNTGNAGSTLYNIHSSGTVTGDNEVGGLVGFIDKTDVARATSSVTVGPDVESSSGIHVGGIIGRAYESVLANVSATGNITGVSYVGGLIGSTNLTTVSSATASGAIEAADNYGGGLIGLNRGNLSDISATGAVSGGDRLGGLVGSSENGSITNATASGNISGTHRLGGLIGQNNNGTINTAIASGSVTGSGDYVGGLVGTGAGDIIDSSASGAVTGDEYVGGLVGEHFGATNNGDATGTVQGSNWVGGLLGFNDEETVQNSTATGDVTGGSYVGGLIGQNKMGTVSTTNATGLVTATGDHVGGLVGHNKLGAISDSFATKDVSGHNNVGGLVGFSGGSISGSNAIGDVSGNEAVGGLLGFGENTAPVSTSYAEGNVTATGNFAGGLVGSGRGAITNSHAIGVISGMNTVGGLAGFSSGTVNSVYATGNVTGTGNAIGGLVGENRGTITTASASGLVTGVDHVGGLVGDNYAVITAGSAISDVIGSFAVGGLVGRNNNPGNLILNSSASGDVTASAPVAGGLVGENYGDITNGVASGVVNGVEAAGGLAGANYGVITGSLATGNVTSTAAFVGGLVGDNYGLIDSSEATGDVIGVGATGGLAGYNEIDADITNSIARGDVTGTDEDTGGFVGYNDEDASISGSEAHGVVIGTSQVGGFAGSNYGTITTSEARGNTSGDDRIGGFAGASEDTGVITNSQAYGSATGTDDNVGGFIGKNYGLVDTVSAVGAVIGVQDVGGLIGEEVGITKNSTASGQVTGTDRVGGLIGYLNSGEDEPATVENSTASGVVTGSTRVGGLIGSSDDAVILNSSATGTVSGISDVGGLVGLLSGVIDTSFATGAVTGTGDKVGGLVGSSESGSEIYTAYATGAVGGINSVGGFIGENNGVIEENSYATGNVTGTNNVGGFVGSNLGNPETNGIVESYATGTVTGEDNIGGFAGISEAFFGGTYATGNVTGYNGVGGHTGRNNGVIVEGEASGDVTAYITSAGGLVGINNSLLAQSSYANGSVTAPQEAGGLIGTNSATGDVEESHVAATVSVSGTGKLGGFVGRNAGRINDSYAKSTVSGEQQLGGFAGFAETTSQLTKVYAEGTVIVTGSEIPVQAGGLVGRNEGLINEAYASVSVSGSAGSDELGGLIGSHYGSLGNAYATGMVIGGNHVGGLIGRADFSTATSTNVYASGAVTATGPNQGGLVGYLVAGTITNGYWDKDATGLSTGIGNNVEGTLVGGGGLSTAQSKLTASYAGFDFSNSGIWKSYNASAAPLLTHWLTPLTVTVQDAPLSYVYDGFGKQDVVSNLSYSLGDATTSGNLYGTAHYDTSKNVGVYTDITGLYSTQHGYNINIVNQGSLTITPKVITVTATGNSKTYDGTTLIGVNLSTTGTVSGDDLGFTGTGNALDKNVATAKTVDVTSITAGGADAGNYSFNTTTQTVADIYKKVISVVAEGINRAYDGTTNIAVQLSSGDLVSGDDVGFSGEGTVTDKNVGQDKDVLVTDITGSGTDVGNYDFNTLAETSVDISKKSILVNAQGVNRAYNGTTAVDVVLSSDGIVEGDDTGFSGTGTLQDKNAGQGKAVAVTGITGAGIDAGNYDYNLTTDTTVDISKKWISLAAEGISRVYDGTTLVGVNILTDEIIENDEVGFTGIGTVIDKNVGIEKAVAVSNIAATGADANNYDYNTTTTTTADITKRAITVAAQGIDKTYDGTLQIGVNFINSDAIVSGDDISFNGTGWLEDKNAGQGKAVSVIDIAGSGADIGNYDYNTSAITSANVAKKLITFMAIGTAKTYDGTTAITASLTPDGIVSGDDLSVSGTAQLADKNAGTGKAIAVTDITGDGLDFGNYDFATTASGTVDVYKKAITVAAQGINRVYDGTTLVGVNVWTDQLIGNDQVSFNGVGTAADKNVGIGKAVAVSNIAATGTDANNYDYNTTAATIVDITRKNVTVAATGIDRAYDGTRNVGVVISASEVVAGDTVTFSGSSLLLDKNVGQAKTVNVSGITSSGTDANNYVFTNEAVTTANITRKTVQVNATGINKTYDGSTAIGVNLTPGGVITGDSFSLSGTGTLDTKNAGTSKAVTVSGITGAGADAGNYAYSTTATTTADVAAKTITVTGQGANKVYDGTTTVAITFTANGLVAGDVVGFTGIGTAADKNVGTGKPVTVSNIAATGIDGANYNPNTSTTTTTNITAKALSVLLRGPISKLADGSAVVTLNGANYLVGGVVDGESISITQLQGLFDNANPGNDKIVTASLSAEHYLAGSNTALSNYQLVLTPITANIGQILSTTTYETAVATASLKPVGLPASTFSTIMGASGPATSTGDSDNGVATGSGGSTIDTGIASIQSRETLTFRRTFSIADGGMRLPDGVTEASSDNDQ